MPNERIDLPQGQGHRRAPVDVLPQKAIGGHADLERRFGGVLDDRRPMFPREREDAQDATDARHAVVLLDVRAHRADVRTGGPRPRQEREGRRRRARRSVLVGSRVVAQGRSRICLALASCKRSPGSMPRWSLTVCQWDFGIVPRNCINSTGAGTASNHDREEESRRWDRT